MLNIEKYKDEIKAEIEKDKTLGCVVNKLMGNKCDDYPKCNDCYLKVLDWLLQDYKGPILTEEEKEYLRNAIKIYGNKFKHIEKQHCGDNDEFKDQDVIYVWIENPKYPSLVTAGMYFFTTYDLQFAGLEFNTYYTLKDLGL